MRRPFETAVSEHGETVLRVCRAVLGPVDADDAWSETFLSAMRAWPDLPDDANVQAWLVTIAHRRALDVARARSRAPRPHGDRADAAGAGEAGRGTPLAAPTSPRSPEDVGAHDDLYAALATLTPRRRAAVAYHHVAGLPHAEVAAVLGCSPAAARRAASDGVADLRRALAADAPRRPGA